MNKNKTFLIVLGLLFSFLFNPIHADTKHDIFCSHVLLTLGICYAALKFRSCPYLYEKNTYKTPEEYLDFLENKVIDWQFLLENSDEDQLNSFRSELLDYYQKIITKRSFFSMLFTAIPPYQPWALFKEELNQHLAQLSSYKHDQYFKKIKNTAFNTNVPLYSQELMDRVFRLKKTLKKIKKHIQGWPTYQNECSQARQEVEISNIYNNFGMFFCFYFAHQILANSMIRFISEKY